MRPGGRRAPGRQHPAGTTGPRSPALTRVPVARVAAVDWSGRLRGAARYIWTAVASEGRLVALDAGRDRDQACAHLIELALADPGLVVGLDFGFSLPVWFLDHVGLDSGLVAPEPMIEGWLRDCPPPFWGRPGRRRGPEPQYRLTELLVAPRARPVFQIGGSGAVGTGSLRGFAVLRRLRAGGFSVWPFDPPRLPMAVEIFPRLLTGPVVKSRPGARARYLLERSWPVEAAVTEDAFDAAVSALVMDRHQAALGALTREPNAVMRREGRIWCPPAPD